MAVQAISLTSLYAAMNVYAVEHRWIESFASHRARPSAEAGSVDRILYGLCTALFPVAVFAWGLVSRRKLQLDLGVLFAALSLVTLRGYFQIAPLWVVLSASAALPVTPAARAPGSAPEQFKGRGGRFGVGGADANW